MKKASFIVIVVAMAFSGCNKNNDTPDNSLFLGGVYSAYTEIVQNGCNSQFQVSDSIYTCNKIEAALYAGREPFNQNTFNISLIDSTLPAFNRIEVIISFPRMDPKTFFRKGSISIDTVNITHCISVASFSETLYGVSAILTWDAAFYENRRFKGHGSLVFPMKMASPNYQDVFYPAQKVEFQFD
ncbi:MAG: hypothetical protein WCR72_15330 [Bacteroidota bacterium]